MAVEPEGTPCWADAMFTDVEGAKSFYGDVLGWTFGESSSEFGNYTQAYANGKAVAAVVPRCPARKASRHGACTSRRRTPQPPQRRSVTTVARC